MKKIKPTELKEGDWIRTKGIHNILIEDKIYSKHQVAEILYIKRNKVGKDDIYLKNVWNVHRDRFIVTNMLANVEKIYLLNKKERSEFVKKLILMNLEDKNG